MRTRATTIRGAIAAVLALPALASPAQGALAPGDIVVADPSAAALIKVDPVSGQQSLISDNSISGPDLLEAPMGVALEPGGTLLVADADGPSPGSEGALIRVDPVSGGQALVSDNEISVLDLFESPSGVVVGPDGEAYVSDADADGGDGAVIRVDPGSGQQSLVSANSVSINDYFEKPVGIAREFNGRLAVADGDAPPGADDSGAVVGVEVGDFDQTLISDNLISTSDLFTEPTSVAVEASGNLLVTNVGLDPASTGVLRVVRATGQQFPIATGAPFVRPFGVALDASRRAIVTDSQGGPDGMGSVLSVDPSDASRSVISNNSLSPPGLLAAPAGVLVVPPTCLGRYATIVGSNRTDTLMGTAGPDVIVTQGGNDQVQAKDGADLLCGGDGRNRLVGGNGKDQFLGGPRGDVILANNGADIALGENGADKIDGGSGKDRLVGGNGRDTLVGGRTADKLYGNSKRDRLRGSQGNDLLKGGAGPDKLLGGSGHDRLRGGPGHDKQKQ
jgi:Ca2+-binding RTX toxin-like protein